MSIPNLAQPFLLGDGKINPNFVLMMQQLVNELQRALNGEGWKPPQLDTATITQLNTAASIGSFVFNKTTGKFMGNESGTFKTFTTS
jgi:hypothetical protein